VKPVCPPYNCIVGNLSSVSQNVLKFFSSLPVKRGESLSFLTIFTFAVPVIGLDMTENRILPYVI
jgi:hypothetical protein